MSKSLFLSSSYREFLTEAVQRSQATAGKRAISYSKLADACRVQKTYLSRALKGKSELSADQFFLALESLSLTAEEKKYGELLHELDRSQVPQRQERIRARISAFRDKVLKTEHYLRSKTVKNETAPDRSTIYYLDPDLQLVHLFLTIPRYAQNPSAIAKDLPLGPEKLDWTIRTLADLGIIAHENGKIVVREMDLHLASKAEIIVPYHAMLRIRSAGRLGQVLQHGRQRGYSYSLVFSADEATKLFVQENFLAFLKRAATRIRSAPSERVYQMTFDLLPW